jgi:uncharacterized membrane protein YidH (DUF202 family)
MTTPDEPLAAALALKGLLDDRDFSLAESSAAGRGVSLEKVLVEDCAVPKAVLRGALAARFGAAALEYDERLSIPGELLDRFHAQCPKECRWFPVGKRRDGTLVVAATDPGDEALRREVAGAFGEGCLLVPALEQDVHWLTQDFGTRDNGRIVGAERTDLAFWRNILAQWRTHLACYRTDMAKGRTGLNIMRFGLGLIALADGMLRQLSPDQPTWPLWASIAAGVAIALLGFYDYLCIRRTRLRPPEVQTLVEVTAVTLSFLEEFHFLRQDDPAVPPKTTMLGRLGDFLCGYSTVLSAYPAYRQRIHLARERNILAAQRTIGACYRTIAARARTGLSFLRTGVTLTGLGLGLVKYFGLSFLTAFDALLVLAGVGMICDGAMWYLPVRGEYIQTPRCDPDI